MIILFGWNFVPVYPCVKRSHFAYKLVFPSMAGWSCKTGSRKIRANLMTLRFFFLSDFQSDEQTQKEMIVGAFLSWSILKLQKNGTFLIKMPKMHLWKQCTLLKKGTFHWKYNLTIFAFLSMIHYFLNNSYPRYQIWTILTKSTKDAVSVSYNKLKKTKKQHIVRNQLLMLKSQRNVYLFLNSSKHSIKLYI